MAALSRERALYLLATANNHGDLSVKLSSLSQVRDILLSMEPSYAAEIFPYLIELQTSPESLVRKLLIEVIEDVGLKAVEQSSLLMSVLLLFLNDGNPVVARQSIVSGTNLFCSVLGEMALQFHRWGRVDRWLEELWTWMIKFKDAVFAIGLEPGSIGKRLLALKFLETYVILFTPEANDSEKPASEATERSRQAFNISWLVGGYPVLDPVALMSDANRTISILLNLLRSANSLPGPLTITVVSWTLMQHAYQLSCEKHVEFDTATDGSDNGSKTRLWLDLQNGGIIKQEWPLIGVETDGCYDHLLCWKTACLASIARKRPVHYDMILSGLLDFDPNFEPTKGCHAPSIQYSIRTAFLGFLRSTYPTILESRERLLGALRAMNAGDAADQVIRQVSKMIKVMDRASRDGWPNKDDAPTQFPNLVDLSRKRLLPPDNEEPANGHEMTTSSKRIRFGADTNLISRAQTNDIMEDPISNNGEAPDVNMLNGGLTPVEQMIAMIGALLAEGERGAESLGILVSQIHPDMLADIVITNMKHLPKAPPPLTRIGHLATDRQANVQGQVLGSSTSCDSMLSPVLTAQLSVPLSTTNNPSLSDTAAVSVLDSKRDPRRDPRRLDPRRVRAPSVSSSEDAVSHQTDIDGSISKTAFVTTIVDNPSTALLSKLRSEDKIMENTMESRIDPKIEVLEESDETITAMETNTSSEHISAQEVNKELLTANSIENPVTKADDISSFMDSDQHSPSVSNASTSEETCQELPLLPSYVELTSDQQINVKMLAVERIIDSCKNLCGMDWQQLHSALLARLFAQIDADDSVVGMLQKHAVLDYQQQRGHELVLHVLYHLHSLVISDSVDGPSHAAVVYEKFFSAVAKSFLESFPASDKSFSRLLGEVPVVPDSVLQLLDDLCFSDVTDNHGKELRDVERVTQGLGTVWNLIVKRPLNRQAYLDIALKCAVHSQDEIRSTAIRLVANKLYQLSYVSDNIEKHATEVFLSAVDAEIKVESQETSISGAESSEPGTSENETTRTSQTGFHGSSSLSFSEAQRLISLYFALCIKKPTLLQLVFQTYGRSPKAVKQAVHRHMPILIRALGSSYSELLRVISDPPQGSEHLFTLVLQILTQEMTPSTELIATVKHLYETKLKDVTILIPMLSSLSKTEVLPIFPRLLDLPLEKFQTALAHILQGSAHTGPALTPAEVLVAIHAIVPEKDGIALKKITDACSACFEQRTVFTQQVLAKALNQMVDQTPLPLLFMRTVIQAIDAFPSLVDFVMEILSKLVNKQVWRMPKMWFGFLKCAFQTQPHSFQVLLQLPPAQLENALNKYPNHRSSLAAYASQPSIKSSLSRATLAVLGFQKEMLVQQPQPHSSSLYSSDTNSSVRGSTLT